MMCANKKTLLKLVADESLTMFMKFQLSEKFN